MTVSRRHAAAALAAFTGGCTLLAPVDTSVTTSMIDQVPADPPLAQRPAGVLLVYPPECRPAYDTTRMAYSTRPHELAFYARHEWGERPGQMLLPLVVRTLQETHCCGAVATAPYVGAFAFTLRTEVHELVQDFGVDPPQLRIALRILVGDRERVIATGDIQVTEPMRQKNAEAGVEAANIAVATALRLVAQKVVQVLDARGASS
jgi:cholesterol transport system auxiliary component